MEKEEEKEEKEEDEEIQKKKVQEDVQKPFCGEKRRGAEMRRMVKEE